MKSGSISRKPYWVYGGLQDNGTWGAPMATLNNTGVSNDEWIRTGGGDGFYAQVDPKDWNIVYTESQNGAVQRLNLATTESKSIRPQPPEGSTDKYRFDWNSPIMISPRNKDDLYGQQSSRLKSLDRGDNWRRPVWIDQKHRPQQTEIHESFPNPMFSRGTMARIISVDCRGCRIACQEGVPRVRAPMTATSRFSRDSSKTERSSSTGWKEFSGTLMSRESLRRVTSMPGALM
ncbi:MAG: hypothetical protein IPJ07_20565 [Acidobacteria bacterium]|nr:hypothetical protein [Acidobacteriota bacterium]